MSQTNRAESEAKLYWQYGYQDKATRRKFNIGDILCNAAVCHNCGEIVRSNNRHDYKSCPCGNVSVDGGSWYVRRTFKGIAHFDDIVVYYNDAETK